MKTISSIFLTENKLHRTTKQEIKIFKIGKVNAFRESLCILHVVEIKIYDVVLRYVKTQNLHNLSYIVNGFWVVKVQIDNGW